MSGAAHPADSGRGVFHRKYEREERREQAGWPVTDRFGPIEGRKDHSVYVEN